MIDEAISSKLDQVIGELSMIRAEQTEQGGRLDDLCERTALVEKGVCDTKDVVTAWTAAKTSMRFIKGWAGFVATLATIAGGVVGLYFTIKNGLSR